MACLESCFHSEMEFARRMRPADHDYWAGYSIGLLNGYSTDRAIPRAVHSWLLEQPELNTRARGYRAGYRFIDVFAVESEHADPASARLAAQHRLLHRLLADTR